MVRMRTRPPSSPAIGAASTSSKSLATSLVDRLGDMDVSELEAVRVDLQQQMIAHARTLDQLSTAVAIFDRRKQLVFHNAAYRQLWSLEVAFLDQHPSESEILDRLRAKRMLPEQADFRAWKEAHLAGYQSPDTDRRGLVPARRPHASRGRQSRTRKAASPISSTTSPPSSISSRSSTPRPAFKAKRSTALKEGVAVFSSDGRLKLSNAAFATRLWRHRPGRPRRADPTSASSHRLCADLCPGRGSLGRPAHSRSAGLHEQRTGIERRLTCRDGSIFDCSVAPLPDGATLLTFTDTTASVNVERALTDRNQALLETEKLRNDFVHHVSYELRSPLTNIIGFIQLLGDGIDRLAQSPSRREYVGYVMKSSAPLCSRSSTISSTSPRSTPERRNSSSSRSVDILATIRAAVEGVQDRLAESSLSLQILAADDIGSFTADAEADAGRCSSTCSRMRSGSPPPGQTVTLYATRRGNSTSSSRSPIRAAAFPTMSSPTSSTVSSPTRSAPAIAASASASPSSSPSSNCTAATVLIVSAPGEGTSRDLRVPRASAGGSGGGTRLELRWAERGLAVRACLPIAGVPCRSRECFLNPNRFSLEGENALQRHLMTAEPSRASLPTAAWYIDLVDETATVSLAADIASLVRGRATSSLCRATSVPARPPSPVR